MPINFILNTQIVDSAVTILDGISGWEVDVVQQESSKYDTHTTLKICSFSTINGSGYRTIPPCTVLASKILLAKDIQTRSFFIEKLHNQFYNEMKQSFLLYAVLWDHLRLWQVA